MKEWLAQTIAGWLPRRLVYWCALRVAAHATQGPYGTQIVPELFFMDALKRWESAIPLAIDPLPVPALQDIEQYRMQMAGISTAALGYWKADEPIHPDYDTPAVDHAAELESLDGALRWDSETEIDLLAGMAAAEIVAGPFPIPAHCVNWNRGKPMRWPQRDQHANSYAGDRVVLVKTLADGRSFVVHDGRYAMNCLSPFAGVISPRRESDCK